MLEIYFFVNPLDASCLRFEHEFLEYIANSTKKIQFRFIPLLNLQIIDQYMTDHNLPKEDIDLRNKLFQSAYAASLDVKALQLQGKKIGRAYLLAIQEAIGLQNHTYNCELVTKLLTDVNGDPDMFDEDRNSQFVKESFRSDQQIASEMGIQAFPSAVVFNYEFDCDFGVLIENIANFENICHLYETIDKSYYSEYVEKTSDHLGLHLL